MIHQIETLTMFYIHRSIYTPVYFTVQVTSFCILL